MAETAFREHASGLIVPAELSREREVWTWAEWMTLEKAAKLLTSRGIRMFLGCRDPRCQKTPMTRLRRPDGGITMQCEHKDRMIFKKV